MVDGPRVPLNNPRMAIAFFDLDRTVLAVNSATLWLKRELHQGHISRTFAVRGAAWVALYQLGFGKMEDVIGRAMQTVAGMSESVINDRTQRFYDEEVSRLVRPGATAAISKHRAQGDRVVLLTSSSAYLSQPFVRDLQLDGYLCNLFEVKDGMMTGRPDGALCFGAGKLVHATSYANTHDVTLDACALYTDSYSDLPVLDVVGTPVAVNPDIRLRRAAKRRGWRIEDWGTPS